MIDMLARMHAIIAQPGWLDARPSIRPVMESFGAADS